MSQVVVALRARRAGERVVLKRLLAFQNNQFLLE